LTGTVYVGPHRFRVKMQNGCIGVDGNHGSCATASREITLSRGFNPCYTDSVLVHEIVEAFNSTYDIGLNHPQINQMEQVIYSLITQNPLLVAQIQRNYHKSIGIPEGEIY
jgi:hypothetical protein